MRFCLKCGKDYKDDDTIKWCDQERDGERCKGDVSGFPKEMDNPCLVCLDRGHVEIQGEKVPCHRGCGKNRRNHVHA